MPSSVSQWPNILFTRPACFSIGVTMKKFSKPNVFDDLEISWISRLVTEVATLSPLLFLIG